MFTFFISNWMTQEQSKHDNRKYYRNYSWATYQKGDKKIFLIANKVNFFRRIDLLHHNNLLLKLRHAFQATLQITDSKENPICPLQSQLHLGRNRSHL